MIKKVSLTLVILLIVFSVVVYYFFALNLRLENQTHYDISSVKCQSTTGDSWNFKKISSSQSISRILLLPHGSALICDFDVIGYASESTVVVGYFTENVGEIVLVVKDEGNNLVIVINEDLGDEVRLNGMVELTRVAPQ
jgi:hypothetical protein